MICCLNFCFKVLLFSFLEVKHVRVGIQEACWRARYFPPLWVICCQLKKKKEQYYVGRQRGASFAHCVWRPLGLLSVSLSPESTSCTGGTPCAPKHMYGCVPTLGDAPSALSGLRKVQLIHLSLNRGRVLPSPSLDASFSPSPVSQVQSINRG